MRRNRESSSRTAACTENWKDFPDILLPEPILQPESELTTGSTRSDLGKAWDKSPQQLRRRRKRRPASRATSTPRRRVFSTKMTTPSIAIAGTFITPTAAADAVYPVVNSDAHIDRWSTETCVVGKQADRRTTMAQTNILERSQLINARGDVSEVVALCWGEADATGWSQACKRLRVPHSDGKFPSKWFLDRQSLKIRIGSMSG